MIIQLLYGQWLKGLDNFTCSYYVKVRASKNMGKLPVLMKVTNKNGGYYCILIQRTNMQIKRKLCRSVNHKI